jgi:hypothetical protein
MLASTEAHFFARGSDPVHACEGDDWGDKNLVAKPKSDRRREDEKEKGDDQSRQEKGR